MDIHFYTGPMLVCLNSKEPHRPWLNSEELTIVSLEDGTDIWLPNFKMEGDEKFIFSGSKHSESGKMLLADLGVITMALAQFRARFEAGINELTKKYRKADVCYGAVAYYM